MAEEFELFNNLTQVQNARMGAQLPRVMRKVKPEFDGDMDLVRGEDVRDVVAMFWDERFASSVQKTSSAIELSLQDLVRVAKPTKRKGRTGNTIRTEHLGKGTNSGTKAAKAVRDDEDDWETDLFDEVRSVELLYQNSDEMDDEWVCVETDEKAKSAVSQLKKSQPRRTHTYAAVLKGG